MKFIVAILLSFGVNVAYSASLLKNLLLADIVDDVKTEIDRLRGMVLDLLKKSAEDLDSIFTNVTSFSDGVHEQQSIEVDNIFDPIHNYLDQLHQAADEAGVNISACTAGTEPAIKNLPVEVKGLIRNCLDVEVTKASTVVATSHYNTDIIINKVDQFQFQVMTCRGDDDCLISLVTQIYQAKVDIPRQITEEVNKAQSDVKPFETNMNQCAKELVNNYDELINMMFYYVYECVAAAVNG